MPLIQKSLVYLEKILRRREKPLCIIGKRKSLKNSLSLDKESVEKLLEKGEKYVIRFLSPENQKVKTVDVIRGESIIDSSLLDDKILIKANGTPTYHFANVVDDHLMKITHVIRGKVVAFSSATRSLI